MSKRVGILTGCGKGIGLAIIKNLLLTNKDYYIVGISRTSNSELDSLRKLYKERFLFFESKIEDSEKILEILDFVNKRYGEINFGICNAGIRSRLSISESSLEVYRNVLEINTISNINIAKKLISISLENHSACNILFVSSIVGTRGFDELSTYAVSKSALEGFMRSASVEYAKDSIQLNCLAPGFVESSYAENFKENRKDLYKWTIAQTPMGRWGKCEEMANIASFMISEQNSFMTGTTIYSDGGWTAK